MIFDAYEVVPCFGGHCRKTCITYCSCNSDINGIRNFCVVFGRYFVLI